jgi:hypothetical protein
MHASVRALLASIIDYAGLFPPAKLQLDRAIRNFARHRQSPEQWMLGRFVIPAARLGELEPFSEILQQDPPMSFAVLGRGGATSDEFQRGFADDLQCIADFRERHGDKVNVDVFELKLPDDMVQPQNHHAACYTVVRMADMIEAQGPPALTLFFEIGLAGDWRTSVRQNLAILEHLTGYGRTRFLGPYKRCRQPGVKLRCGGLQASAFPTQQQLGNVIVGCRERGFPIKATAGLHHPVRSFDDNLRTHMHGFLNLFVAMVLAATHPLNEDQVRHVIEDTDGGHFVFDDIGLRWNELWANLADITTIRQKFAIAFGSCSFDEPREDLRALKLLD